MAISLPVADPTIQPTVSPILSSPDILGEIDRAHASLSQPAQDAIQHAHALMGLQAPGTPPAMPEAPFQGIKPPVTSPLPSPPPLPSGPATPPLLGSVRPGLRGLTPPVNPSVEAHQGNLARLTAPARLSGDPLAHTSADTGLPGTGQIHNPWGRVPLQILDAVGRGVVPGIEMGLPGTSGHHDVLVRQAGEAVKGDEAAQAARDKSTLEQSQAGEAQARTENLENPEETPRTLTTANGIMQWNPSTKRFDIPAGEAPEKVQNSGKTVTTDQGIMQWDPKSETYSIKVGNAPDKETADKTLQDADGVWYHVDKDHKASPITVDGKPFQGKVADEKTASSEQQFIDEYRADPKNAKNGAKPSIADAEKAFKAITPPEKPQHSLMMIPDGSGGYVATDVAAGSHVAPGALTSAGVNTQNEPTAQTRTMAETAPKVLDLAKRVGDLVDQQAKTLGPASSRWNEFMAGKVGAPNPEFTKLRTDVGLLQTALMRMHVGARGGEQMMQHFQNLLDVAKQSPENLKAALDEITAYANQVKESGKAAGTKQQLPGGISLEDIDAEIDRRKKAGAK